MLRRVNDRTAGFWGGSVHVRQRRGTGTIATIAVASALGMTAVLAGCGLTGGSGDGVTLRLVEVLAC